MQPKVSMVVPCYNKAEYIGNMFDSIIAQRWDNIELILVNDGSTDGTRKIIGEYEPKFLARGFELVIIDQENMGLPGAVYQGLKRITGEFVCQIDADDELDPEYVSTMAGWLWDHAEYSWAACEVRLVREDSTICVNPFPLGVDEHFKMETFILIRMMPSIWKYMIRTAYLKSCRVVEYYFHERFGSQEPQMLLPLFAGKGKFKYFPVPLYTMMYFQPDTHHSYNATYKAAAKYHKEWFVPVKKTIQRLHIDDTEKQRLFVIADFSYCKQLLVAGNTQDNEFKTALPALIKQYIELVKVHFAPSPALTYINLENIYELIQATEDNILGIRAARTLSKPCGRIIAWGVLGKRGRRLLPGLKGTPFEPAELWDAAGDGVAVKKPDPASLGPDDLVFILPVKGIAEKICAELAETGCGVMLSDEIAQNMAYRKYPQFYDGSLKFVPNI